MTQYEQDILAEITALNTAVISALKAIARQQDDPQKYLKDLLEHGLVAMGQTNYWSVPADKKEVFLENARARYTDIVTSVRVT